MNDNMNDISKCPVMGSKSQLVGANTANQHWFPEQLNLSILSQNHPASNPLGHRVGVRTPSASRRCRPRTS